MAMETRQYISDILEEWQLKTDFVQYVVQLICTLIIDLDLQRCIRSMESWFFLCSVTE